jgi:4-amino-4-deoxy-L-arabinose transferase-like glycosyltransferase
VLIVYALLARDGVLWRRLHVASGALLMLAIAAPWFVLVSMRNPEFPQFFFIHEHWQRYTSTIHQRAAPLWYFVPLLLIGFLPWLGLSLRIQRLVRDEPRPGGFRPILLLAVWAGAIFVFFSLSSSKLPGYIMPIFPALAVLAALALAKVDRRVWGRQIIGAAAVVSVGLVALLVLDLSGSGGAAAAGMRDFARWVAGASAIALCGFAVAAYLNRAGATFDSIVAYSLTAFVATTVGMLGHETLGRGVSGIDLVAPVRAVLTPEMPIYSVRLLDHTLPFYLRRTTIMVEGPDELEFGTRQEPEKWLPTIAAFRKEWSSGRHALALMSPATYAELREDGVAMNKVAADGRRVVVANFPVAAP